MAFVHSPKISTDGLVLCLDAANVKSYAGSGTTWTDLGGNGRNGSLINGPTFNSANGGSIVFDGVDDVVQVTTPTYTNYRSFTTMFWIKSTSLIDPAVRKGICFGRNMSTGYLSLLGFTPGTGGNAIILFESRDSTNSTYGSVSTPQFNLYSTNWVMIGMQVTPTSLTAFYNNGIKYEISTSSDTRQGFSFSGWELGQDASAFKWTGNIASFLFYDKVLSSDEILQNFNATRGRFGI